jgi:putative aldouronate transport system permease protein
MCGFGTAVIAFVAVYFPWITIGRFEFRLLDYFVNNSAFTNGIQWFSGFASRGEAQVTYIYLTAIYLLLIPIILVIFSLIGHLLPNFKLKGLAVLAGDLALLVSAIIPFFFVISIAIINSGEPVAQMSMFIHLALVFTVTPLLLLILFTRFSHWRFSIRLFREKTLWLISGLALLWLFIFAYIPMIGIVTAFFNYRPGMSFSELDFVGFRFFREFIILPDFMRILRNTLVISGLNLTIGFVAPIIFALLLNELRNRKFKRVTQTISYMPYFVSMVVVASIMFTLLGSDGVINEILMNMGVISSPVSFMNNSSMFWGIMLSANIWKNVGWGSIIYLAAIAGVDHELYEAGAVDGLGRFGRAWHITLPGIRQTVILLFILGIGNILNTGFEYQLLVGTPLTRDVHEVVDTYVFRFGIQQGRYSFATAVGLMKSAIGFTLVLIANWTSKKISDISII